MIEQSKIDELVTRAEENGVTPEFLSKAKESNPDLIIRSEDDDNLIESTPIVSRPDFNLYLVDTREHCLTLTKDLSRAGGVLFGIISDEED